MAVQPINDKSLLLAAALLLVAAFCVPGAKAEYVCLTNSTTVGDVPLRQATLFGMKRSIPNCRKWYHYCRTVIALYPKTGDTVYLAVGKFSNCENAKAHIIRAIEDRTTYRRERPFCRKLDAKQVVRWNRRRYLFRPLIECVENICTSLFELATWQVQQRSFCRLYLAE